MSIDDIKVGDYVRTKDYGFIKVKSFYYNEDMIHILDENCNEYDFSKELVDDFKSSPNIIDLIEVGDYVNGIQINERIGDSVWHFSAYGDEDECLKSKDIKTIVTHEQMKAMEYKIER